MDFFNLLRSAEELLFELASLILLYPRTLWRSLRRSQQLREKINQELGQEGQRRFDDMVSPPLCLLLSVAIGIGLSSGSDAAGDINELGAWIMHSFYNQLIFGALVIAMMPLMHAWLQLRAQRQPLNRDNLRRPFYLQACLISPMALLLPAGLSLAFNAYFSPFLRHLALALAVLSLAAYVVNSVRVTRHVLGCGTLRALWLTCAAIAVALGIGLLMLFALIDPTAASRAA